MNRRDLLRAAAALSLAQGATGCASGGAPAVDVVPGRGPVLPSPPTGLFGALSERLVAALGSSPRNMALSPWSIGTVLAMIRGGARGDTARQLDAVLALEAPALPASVNTVWRAMASSNHATLRGANAVWAQRDFAWERPYLDHLAAFGAPLQERDIEADPDSVRRQVNEWVRAMTRAKIPELLRPGLIKPSTRLVLANALHVASAWQRPLNQAGEHAFTSPGGVRQVPWLVGGGWWAWHETPDAVGAALPCEGGDFALVLLRPAPGRTPAGVLTLRAVASVLDGSPTPVSCGLPRFTIDAASSLAQVMPAIGVRDAFDPDRADFSGMTTRERLFVSFLEHQAVITVDDKGIEAAAATAAGIDVASSPAAPKELILDRPFAYALVHGATRTPLFVGVLADPA